MSHHIVIVEDEPVTQARLQAYFEQEGYHVSVTANGAGLRDIMEHEHVSLILLDINLPDENGLMLTRALRERSTVGIILVKHGKQRRFAVFIVDIQGATRTLHGGHYSGDGALRPNRPHRRAGDGRGRLRH